MLLKELKNKAIIKSSNPILRHTDNRNEIRISKKCQPCHAALFTIAKVWRQIICPLADEG
jgi:hypothetical protein